MAVEFTIKCDGCGHPIAASDDGPRHARALAQLQCGAYCGGGKDWCAGCRTKRAALPEGASGTRGAHSAGQTR